MGAVTPLPRSPIRDATGPRVPSRPPANGLRAVRSLPALHGEAEEQPGEAAGPVPPGRGESVRAGHGHAAGAGGDGAGVADAAGRAGRPAAPPGNGGPGPGQYELPRAGAVSSTLASMRYLMPAFRMRLSAAVKSGLSLGGVGKTRGDWVSCSRGSCGASCCESACLWAHEWGTSLLPSQTACESRQRVGSSSLVFKASLSLPAPENGNKSSVV